MSRNLLRNPCGEEDLEFWELMENGGNGWTVEDMPGDCGPDFCNDEVKKYFATSFDWCSKKQVINLLEEDFSPEELDAQPEVTVEDWYCSRTDCGCEYRLAVYLLNDNQEVIQEFKPELVVLDPEKADCSWQQIKYTFSEYDPGMRYISFEHGGKDTNYWHGWYGVRVTGSSVTINL